MRTPSLRGGLPKISRQTLAKAQVDELVSEAPGSVFTMKAAGSKRGKAVRSYIYPIRD